MVDCMLALNRTKYIKETGAELCLSTGGHHWFDCEHYCALHC